MFNFTLNQRLSFMIFSLWTLVTIF